MTGSVLAAILRGAQASGAIAPQSAPTGERNCVHPGDDGDRKAIWLFDI